MASIETRILVATHNLAAAVEMTEKREDAARNEQMANTAALYASAATLLGSALALTRLAEKALGGREIKWPST